MFFLSHVTRVQVFLVTWDIHHRARPGFDDDGRQDAADWAQAGGPGTRPRLASTSGRGYEGKSSDSLTSAIGWHSALLAALSIPTSVTFHSVPFGTPVLQGWFSSWKDFFALSRKCHDSTVAGGRHPDLSLPRRQYVPTEGHATSGDDPAGAA